MSENPDDPTEQISLGLRFRAKKSWKTLPERMRMRIRATYDSLQRRAGDLLSTGNLDNSVSRRIQIWNNLKILLWPKAEDIAIKAEIVEKESPFSLLKNKILKVIGYPHTENTIFPDNPIEQNIEE